MVAWQPSLFQSLTYLALVTRRGVDPLPHCPGFKRGAQAGLWVHLRIIPGQAPFLVLHCQECHLNAALKLAGCLGNRLMLCVSSNDDIITEVLALVILDEVIQKYLILPVCISCGLWVCSFLVVRSQRGILFLLGLWTRCSGLRLPEQIPKWPHSVTRLKNHMKDLRWGKYNCTSDDFF